MSAMIMVTTAAELAAALDSAVGGETLCLDAGHYGQLTLNAATHPHLAFASAVTLVGVGAPLPAVFSGLHLSGVAHLAFEGIVFDTQDAHQDLRLAAPTDADFKLVACTDIAFQGCIFQGCIAQGAGGSAAAPKISCGLTLSACRGLRIDTCRLQRFSHGIVALGSENLTITGCDLSTISMDAMLLIDTKAVRIEGNFLHDLGPQGAANLPVTMLHFRTKATGKPHRDVILRNNVLDMGLGCAARGIVMTTDSETVLACDGLLIEGNLIVTRHRDGIALGPVSAATIQHNSVLMGPTAAASKSAAPIFTAPIFTATAAPQIIIDPRAQNITVIKNAVFGIVGASDAPLNAAAWTVRQNAFVQAGDPTLPGWYGDVFETPNPDESGAFPPLTARFVARKGSMLDSLGAGVPSSPPSASPPSASPTPRAGFATIRINCRAACGSA